MSQQVDQNMEKMQEYNETFTSFEARIGRLDESVNNMVRKSRDIFTKILFILLQLIVWIIGTVISYSVSVVYFFWRKPKEEKGEAC